MATGYGAATTDLAAMLTAAGVEVETNVQDIQLPGGWLTPSALDYDRMGEGAYTGAWSLYLIASGNEPTDSLDDLSTMAGKVRDVFPAFRAEAVTVQLANHSPEPLPALLITIEMDVT